MVYIEKPPLAASSAGNEETLARTSSNKLMLQVIVQLAIFSAVPIMLAINKHGIRNTVLIDRATLAPGKEPPTNAPQRLPVENDLQTDLEANKRKPQAEPTKYVVDQMVSHKGSGGDLRY